MASRIHENDIRDQLATRLYLIEPGLRLFKTEYPLPNRNGTAGRVDILAIDSTGCYVVIELKRTESAAERALHELAKYVELFRQEKGLGPADVRVVVAAVEWRGLHTAFSQAAREWSVNLQGYHLVLAGDGVTPQAAQRIQPLPAATLAELTPIQIFIQPRDGNTEAAWQWAVHHLSAAHAHNLVGFEFTHPIYDDGIYLVLGKMSANVSSFTQGTDGDLADLEDGPDSYECEYEALSHLLKMPNPFTIENGHPHSLASLMSNQSWTLKRVRRSGVYLDTDFHRDKELLLSASTGGLSDIRFSGTARASHAQRWQRLLWRIDFALGGNPTWAATMRAWLDDLAAHDEEVEVFAHIYNPCDLITAIAFGWPDKFGDYLPSVFCVARSPKLGMRRIDGALSWNGIGIGPFLAFELAYSDSERWMIARNYGEAWRFDEILLQRLGLKYFVSEKTYGTEPSRYLLDWDNGILTRELIDQSNNKTGARIGFLPLNSWVDEYQHELSLLATRIRYDVHIVEYN